MTEKIGIVADSGSCLQHYPGIMELTKAYNAPAHVHYKGKTLDYTNTDLDDYYQQIKSDKKDVPKTTAATPQDFMKAYETMRERGYTHILSIQTAIGLSATINAAHSVKGNFEDLTIELIDTGGVGSVNLAVLVKAQQLIDEGKSFEIIVEELREFSKKQVMYGAVTTLDWLRRVGRLNAVKYRFGKLLRLKPVTKTTEGEVVAFDNAKSHEGAIDKTYKYAVQGYERGDDIQYVIIYSRSFDDLDMKEMAKGIESRLKSDFPKAKGYLGEFGVLMVTATGPGGLGITVFK